MTARRYPDISDLTDRTLGEIKGRFARGGLTGDDLLAIARNTEAVAEVVAIAKRLLDGSNHWSPVKQLFVPVATAPALAPDVYVTRMSELGLTIFVLTLKACEVAGESPWDSKPYNLSSAWTEVAPGVEVRWPNDFAVGTIQVRTRVKPVAEEAGVIDDEADWNPSPRRHYVSRGDELVLTPEVRVRRAPNSRSWRVQSWGTIQNVVNGSTEWRDVAQGIQVRWPNGISDGIIEVRTP